MNDIERKVPGWDSYPTYTYKCESCGKDTTIITEAENDLEVVCPHCKQDTLKLLFISYPTDGPGFQEGYDPSGLVYGGGAASDKEGTDIAGLPLNSN